MIDGKISFGGKLGPMLTLSWLVRVQFGAKRGKLTRFRGPKSVQEHAKSVPRAEKVAQGVLGGLYVGCMWVVCGLYVGCIWLQVVVVRRSWEAGGRGKERVNLSDIGHQGLLV